MKTMTIISIAVDVNIIHFGFTDLRDLNSTIELNEHVKRKQNE